MKEDVPSSQIYCDETLLFGRQLSEDHMTLILSLHGAIFSLKDEPLLTLLMLRASESR